MKFYIDVGHGQTGTDSGASATSGKTTYYENDRNLRIAKATKKYIEEHNHECILSRTENVNFPQYKEYGAADSNIVQSALKCKSGDYDAMISIHCNDSKDKTVRGFLTVWKTGDGTEEKSKVLCDNINKAFKEYKSPEGATIPMHDSRKVQDNGKDHYGCLRLHNKPGVLIEVGFMSNARDLHEILCYYDLIGKAIAEGFIYTYGEVIPEKTIEQLKSENTSLKAENDDLKSQITILNDKIKNYDQAIDNFIQAVKE